jgi:anti-sigma B factor antagonist
LDMRSGRFVAVKQVPERLSVRQGRSFFREVESVLNTDRPRVVLDCSRVRHLDSAGIHVLLCCLEEAMKRNGDVKLASVPAGAAAILELTRVDHLFEAFDSTDEAVDSFHRFPTESFSPAHGREYSTLRPEMRLTSFEGGRPESQAEFAAETTKVSGNWLTRQIAGCLLLLLVAPHAAAVPSPQQAINPAQQIAGPSSTATGPNPSDRGVTDAQIEASRPETLPDSPGTVRAQTADNQPSNNQQPSPRQQTGTQEPLGTAAAKSIKTTGVAASRPAGSAIAPGKQRRARSILIKVGVIAGAGVAVGTVVALAAASPGRPH